MFFYGLVLFIYHIIVFIIFIVYKIFIIIVKYVFGKRSYGFSVAQYGNKDIGRLLSFLPLELCSKGSAIIVSLNMFFFGVLFWLLF